MNAFYAKVIGFLLWLFSNGSASMKPEYLGKVDLGSCEKCSSYPVGVTFKVCKSCEEMLKRFE